ncbi:uncharacterized protein TM35_000141990 [Trypanosoma theileri]|uniref:PIN domain-containing protein n=1 Tax=Trypanosoma theileri TaxID=67003 RepID=A0A1X0NWR9_9TRYP|nr:uncharacterized protein TM35_000141990 [Trypanosoma theileri]ORC88988.1 hypothetical protein TM35_000141990 [Trypanosoma theileri]
MSSLYGSSDSCAYASEEEDEKTVPPSPQASPNRGVNRYKDSLTYYDNDGNSEEEEEEIEEEGALRRRNGKSRNTPAARWQKRKQHPQKQKQKQESQEEEENEEEKVVESLENVSADTRTSFPQSCCFILDTNTLLEADHTEQQKILNTAEKHLVIIPRKVHGELNNMDEGRAGVSLLKLRKWIQKAVDSSGKNCQSSDAADVNDTVHIPSCGFRLQTAKEHCHSVTAVARNNDDHILSCACYFQRLNNKNKNNNNNINNNNKKNKKNKKSRESNMQVYLVTGDVVLSLKAHAEGVGTISTLC